MIWSGGVLIQLLYTNALTRPDGPAFFARAFFAAIQLDRSFAHSNLTFVLRDSLQAAAAFVKTPISIRAAVKIERRSRLRGEERH
jgi:hypothetical protein